MFPLSFTSTTKTTIMGPNRRRAGRATPKDLLHETGNGDSWDRVSLGLGKAGEDRGSRRKHTLAIQRGLKLNKGGKQASGVVKLVRPNVVVEECWGNYCAEAKRSLKKKKKALLGGNAADRAKKKRNQVDADIIEFGEHEIPTVDKVVLIVSRSLNDRSSLPGHVYSVLIQRHRERNGERTRRTADRIEEAELIDVVKLYSRGCRQDAHGVIKHVTATLLEVRPGLGSTLSLTELTATAVERLVFGELYEDIYEEIVEEAAAMDGALMKKMYEFEMEHWATRESIGREEDVDRGESRGGGYPISQDDISIGALEALLSLPEARTPADKLELCATFLEKVSNHFAEQDCGDEDDEVGRFTRPMNAENLISSVVEHIIVAKVPRLNAELAFLEEFARDEQLLRGREGYSLVTLQASVHFLNASKDFNSDVFQKEGGGEEKD